MKTEQHTEIRIDLPVDQAFPHFTPKGEEDWVPGWQPVYLEPESGETREEMVFVTGVGEETTVWTCLKWDPDRFHARYLRVVPQSRVSFVDVRCRADGKDATIARVSYSHVPLSQAGRDFAMSISQASYESEIGDWAKLIHIAAAHSEQ